MKRDEFVFTNDTFAIFFNYARVSVGAPRDIPATCTFDRLVILILVRITKKQKFIIYIDGIRDGSPISGTTERFYAEIR